MLHYLEELFRALDFGSMQDALLQAAAVLLCLSVHETCHGLAAYALGDPTAKSEKRLSLNPLRHIDWVGLAMMFVCLRGDNDVELGHICIPEADFEAFNNAVQQCLMEDEDLRACYGEDT